MKTLSLPRGRGEEQISRKTMYFMREMFPCVVKKK